MAPDKNRKDRSKPPSAAKNPHGRTQEERSRELLRIVHDLAVEVHPHLARGPGVELDSDLDEDVGLDSLARAELLLRLDKAFKVRLPQALIAEAATPRDLLEAIGEAAPREDLTRGRAEEKKAKLAKIAIPERAVTLLEVLAAHVENNPERPHIWLWRSDDEEQCVTYGDLDAGARAVAGGLGERGIQPGERVAIMLPTEAGFFEAFFGVLLAGGVPVPIYPPFRRAQIEEHLRRQAGILRNAQAAFLITDAEIHRVGVLLHSLAGSLRGVEIIGELRQSPPIATVREARSDTIALIQYTSGSTGDPKGVVLTHANLLANIRAMGTVMQAGSSDVFVSWLPLYHDMGLIGAWLGCLYYGAPTAIMPPLAFLADPARWLWSIHRHRATLSAAPNFAYELCLKNVSDDEIRGLDLSSLRRLVNGAEPVSPSTIERFAQRFAPFGYDPEAMAPVYGLAESSVGLAFPPLGRAPLVDRVDREAISLDGVARPAKAGDESALEFVACGQPLPGHQIRVVDASGRELPERREGRVQFKGPSVTSGYFRDKEKTRALFEGDWVESGDRGYVAAGDVFITGRTKDVIIRAGRNIYPHELEEYVGNIEGVRKGCVAAFASNDPETGTERLIVMAESRIVEPRELDALRQRISSAANDLLDLPPDEVVLVAPRTVPKTSSGKIRRSQARAMFEAGLLAERPRALWLQIVRLYASGLGQRLRRGIRGAAELGYAAWWWSVLSLVAAIAWPLVLVLPKREWRHGLVTGLARAFLRLTMIPITVEREAEVPQANAIFVANHASYLDGVVISATISGDLSFVAKEELARQFFAGIFLRRLGAFFVARTVVAESLEDAAELETIARRGARLVIFPEGTLTRMPGLLGFNLGAFLVAAKTGLPIVPVTITGTRSILRGEQWFPRHGRISVHVGKPVLPDGDDFDAAVRLRDRVRLSMLHQSGEPDLALERITIPQA